MDEPRDTIAAIATATGAGGIGVVRISGPAALAIARTVTGREPERLPDRRLVPVAVRSDAGRLDDGLAVAMRGPRSFTGDDVVELHVHGGAVNLGQVLAAVVAAGARPAEPGEFTRRALAAGKIGLVEAEAMLAVVNARTERGWALAQGQLGGELARALARLRTEATALRAEVEATIDFPDEDLDPASRREARARAVGLARSCRALAGSFSAARALTEGLTVALIGPVNAGKSSLLNALCGSERALVSPEPGTTRDYVEARVVWNGVAVTLIDTAGLRDEAGEDAELERRGIELGRRRADTADVVVLVVGPGQAVTAAGATAAGVTVAGATVAGATVVRVASKADLGRDVERGWLATSVVTGEGLDALRATILARVGLVDDVEAGGPVVLTERQRAAATRAADHFDAAAAVDGPVEIVALELRSGADALAELAGERVGEELLDQLFARFCIGK